MDNENFGFAGSIPSAVSVAGNVAYAMAYQATHTKEETILWFKQQVQSKGAWDYKQLDQDIHPGASEYENFGNFNYAAVGTALGMSEDFLRSGAGGAQLSTDYKLNLAVGIFADWEVGNITGTYGSFDNPEDQEQIGLGIDCIKGSMQTPQDTIGFYDGIKAYATQKEYDTFLALIASVENGLINIEDLTNLLQKFGSAENRSDRATQWQNGEGLPWSYNPSTSLTSPLALDLNGDGAISLVSLSKSKTLFDVTGDGMSELTGWIGANDGILVNDANNNGTIDNITEMFGNQVTINGFVALADKMDTNHDGVVNAQDTNFTSLQVWQDTNQDGISQSSELKSLTELGITEIRTASTPAAPSGDLTCSIADGSFVMNGVEQYVADINFEYNAKITNYVGEYNLSVESLLLPWLRGYGNVKDAQIAYSLDEALFTCKTFKTLKALHVKIQNSPKGEQSGAENRVA